jgi:peptidyl-prolyl cis-trans isomerase SurA
MRRLFVLIVVVPSALLLGAGRGRAEVIERVVAKVNGQIITLSDFQSRQITAAQAAHVDPANVAQFLRQNNAKILQDAVDEILILQKAEDQGLRMRAEIVDEVIASIKKDNNITSEEQFQEALAREGMSLGELRQNIERNYTRRMVVQRDIEPRIAVSEDDLRAEYEKRKASDFTKPATVSLQEILIRDDAGGLALANQVVAKARAGDDFQQLARTYSAAPSKANGGEIGDIAQPDMDRQLDKVTSALPVGGVSDPMPVTGGFRILKVTAKTAGSVTPFEGARDKLRDDIMMARFQKEYDAYMAELRKTAQIELRVREVPLRLTGPIPEGSLLENLEPAAAPGAPVPGPTPTTLPRGEGVPAAAPSGAAQSGAAQSGASPSVEAPSGAAPQPPPAPRPTGAGDDEIRTTPQASPEHVAPPTAPGQQPPKDTKPPGR